jgi:predicted O-methyltransferase YrrM
MPIYDVVPLLAKNPSHIAAGRMNDYSLTEKDLLVVLALFQEYKPRRILEFGVNEGSTASFLLENCPFIELYVGVDLIPERFPMRGIVPKKAGWRVGDDPRYESVLTDETVEDFKRKIADYRAFDAIIMDANHEDWATLRDTEACEPFLRSGGLLLWHDYGVESRQHSNGKPFSLIHYLNALEASGRKIMFPNDQPRNPWECVSIAWEVK